MNSFTMIIVNALNMMLYSVIIPALVLSVAMVAFICLLALIVRIGNTDQNTDVGRVNHYLNYKEITPIAILMKPLARNCVVLPARNVAVMNNFRLSIPIQNEVVRRYMEQ